MEFDRTSRSDGATSDPRLSPQRVIRFRKPSPHEHLERDARLGKLPSLVIAPSCDEQTATLDVDPGGPLLDLRNLANSPAFGVMVIDSSLCVVWLNSTLESFFAMTAVRVVGGHQPGIVEEVMAHAVESPDRFVRRVLSSRLNGVRDEGFEFHIIPGEGRKERWVEYWSRPISRGPCAGGRVDYFLDVSHRKLTEQALRVSLRRMKQAQHSLFEAYEHEHHIADVLQRSMLPGKFGAHPTCGIAADYRSASPEAAVGGDFYDCFSVGGRMLVVVGDVSGKGLAAAVHTAMVRYTIRAYAREDPDPGHILRRLNNAMCDFSSPDTFVTVFCAAFSADGRSLTYANAGHDEPFHYRAHGGTAETLGVTGMAVGVKPGADYESREIVLTPGDIVLVYTDGITDARHKGCFFGRERLGEILTHARCLPETEIVELVFAAACDAGNGRLLDDAAVVVFKVREEL